MVAAVGEGRETLGLRPQETRGIGAVEPRDGRLAGRRHGAEAQDARRVARHRFGLGPRMADPQGDLDELAGPRREARGLDPHVVGRGRQREQHAERDGQQTAVVHGGVRPLFMVLFAQWRESSQMETKARAREGSAPEPRQLGYGEPGSGVVR